MDSNTDTLLGCIEPGQLTVLASIFAVVLSEGLSAEERLALASFLVVVGDAIALFDVQEALFDSIHQPHKDSSS